MYNSIACNRIAEMIAIIVATIVATIAAANSGSK
jgi:hypothetical protein